MTTVVRRGGHRERAIARFLVVAATHALCVGMHLSLAWVLWEKPGVSVVDALADAAVGAMFIGPVLYLPGLVVSAIVQLLDGHATSFASHRGGPAVAAVLRVVIHLGVLFVVGALLSSREPWRENLTSATVVAVVWVTLSLALMPVLRGASRWFLRETAAARGHDWW